LEVLMLDFGAIPPEINSGRMYVGPGPGPLLAAAAAWDELSAELQSSAAFCASTIEGLTVGQWTGPSSVAMASAAAPYVAWINAAAVEAGRAGAQAIFAAGCYETAFAATVPPPVVAANRALLMTLIATNFLGQNTPAIAATEAQYVEMWAQDAAAMYAYAGSSATASELTPFPEPPQTTNTSTAATQSAAVAQAGTGNVVTQLSQMSGSVSNAAPGAASIFPPASSAPFNVSLPPAIATPLNDFNSIASSLHAPFNFDGPSTIVPSAGFLTSMQPQGYTQLGIAVPKWLAGPPPQIGAFAALDGEVAPVLTHASTGGGPVSGAMGRAALVGSMSVPQGWTQAAPAIRTLASVLPADVAAAPVASLTGQEGVFSQMALSSLAGRGIGAAATVSRSAGGGAGSVGGVATEADPAAATIIVIPAVED
jgi:PPE-repeat protein